MKTVGVIPARYNSSRFPGKPLADICGKPMIWWVYHQAKKAKKLDDLYVATDDKRIEDICKKYEIPSIMTANNHPTAANRLGEVASKVDGDFFVAINGDEPLINPDNIDLAILGPDDLKDGMGTNIICTIKDPAELMDPSNIKVVFNEYMEALYMSRAPIPFPSKTIDYQFYKHVGIIGYRREMLTFYQNSVPGRFEKIEGIDTLRFIDYGKKLIFIPAEDGYSLSVDTPMDLERVRLVIEKKEEEK
jgi:3-deoxy-manno-octulosonate cytidylyltransferase (CMP-KDO synthetase)